MFRFVPLRISLYYRNNRCLINVVYSARRERSVIEAFLQNIVKSVDGNFVKSLCSSN